MVDARMPDGSRFNAIIPPLALDGACVSIRRFGANPLKLEDLLNFKAFTPEMVMLLEGAIKARLNIIISGGTGSGKTTLLNTLSSFIPNTDRIVTIEDAAELQLQQDHVVRLETRPANIEGKGAITATDLVRNALRMRPERIIIGECRGPEALDMLQAMNTGHEGSLTTIHANTPRDAIARLETMIMMAGFELPLKAMRAQIASAVDLIVQASRLQGGPRKITYITEVVGMEQDTVVMQDIYQLSSRTASTRRAGPTASSSPPASGRRSCRGWSRPACGCRRAPSANASCWRIEHRESVADRHRRVRRRGRRWWAAVAMLLCDKPANRLEDRLDLLTGAGGTPAKDRLLKEGSLLARPLDDVPRLLRRHLSSGSATSACCSSRPTRR